MYCLEEISLNQIDYNFFRTLKQASAVMRYFVLFCFNTKVKEKIGNHREISFWKFFIQLLTGI